MLLLSMVRGRHRPADYRTARKALPQIEIIALGTNSIATSLMLKAGANEGATGENAVVENAGEVDIIVGPWYYSCSFHEG